MKTKHIDALTFHTHSARDINIERPQPFALALDARFNSNHLRSPALCFLHISPAHQLLSLSHASSFSVSHSTQSPSLCIVYDAAKSIHQNNNTITGPTIRWWDSVVLAPANRHFCICNSTFLAPRSLTLHSINSFFLGLSCQLAQFNLLINSALFRPKSICIYINEATTIRYQCQCTGLYRIAISTIPINKREK